MFRDGGLWVLVQFVLVDCGYLYHGGGLWVPVPWWWIVGTFTVVVDCGYLYRGGLWVPVP